MQVCWVDDVQEWYVTAVWITAYEADAHWVIAKWLTLLQYAVVKAFQAFPEVPLELHGVCGRLTSAIIFRRRLPTCTRSEHNGTVDLMVQKFSRRSV